MAVIDAPRTAATGRSHRALLQERYHPDRTQRLERYSKVVALVPAWNEANEIAETVAALLHQKRVPDRVIVIANNCTDDTAEIARAAGAEVLEMHDNKHKKAGALNYGLSIVLPQLEEHDMVLIQDADTRLNYDFVDAAVVPLTWNFGGSCARYDSSAASNLLQRLQSNEFARSRRSLSRKGGETKILVGIATVFSVKVLREVIEARRSGFLPGKPEVYNNQSLTEDYELTLALKSLGYRLTCPEKCRPKTDAMNTLKKLWHQRVRWSRGGLDDLYLYGYTVATRGYIFAQVGRMLALLSPIIYVCYLVSLKLSYGHITWSLPWLLVNVLFMAERVITVREEGPKAMLLAVLLIPELLYDWFMGAAYLVGLVGHLRGKSTIWVQT